MGIDLILKQFSHLSFVHLLYIICSWLMAVISPYHLLLLLFMSLFYYFLLIIFYIFIIIICNFIF